jgi:hypothetical protein
MANEASPRSKEWGLKSLMRTKLLDLNEYHNTMPRTMHLIKQFLNIYSLTEDFFSWKI